MLPTGFRTPPDGFSALGIGRTRYPQTPGCPAALYRPATALTGVSVVTIDGPRGVGLRRGVFSFWQGVEGEHDRFDPNHAAVGIPQ